MQVLLDSNCIEDLAPCVGRLTSCTLLSISNNTLRRVAPESLAGLGAVSRLLLMRNELTVLPGALPPRPPLINTKLSQSVHIPSYFLEARRPLSYSSMHTPNLPERGA
jgi:hypothetical protein